MVVEFAASTFLYEHASEFSVREDEADRLAERLVIARNQLSGRPPDERAAAARGLTTDRTDIRWSAQPPPPGPALRLSAMERQVQQAEPSLATMQLQLWLGALSKGAGIAGHMRLPDGSWVAFRMRGSHRGYALAVDRIMAALLPAVALSLLAGLLIRMTLRPLRQLVQEIRSVGKDTAEARPARLPETGSPEIRDLIHGFNAMRERIQDLIERRTQALAAAGHDLRTPLARLQLRIDAKTDPTQRHAMAGDIAEMEAMIVSLLAFLRGADDPEPVVMIDVAVLAATLVDEAIDRGGIASYEGADHLEAFTRPGRLRRMLSNLIDNALHYGGSAHVTVAHENGGMLFRVEDDGPGIPEARMADVLKPFIRLDEARSRNTGGMGLGLPIVAQLAEAEGGVLRLGNRPGGGFRATIWLPI